MKIRLALNVVLVDQFHKKSTPSGCWQGRIGDKETRGRSIQWHMGPRSEVDHGPVADGAWCVANPHCDVFGCALAVDASGDRVVEHLKFEMRHLCVGTGEDTANEVHDLSRQQRRQRLVEIVSVVLPRELVCNFLSGQ